MTSLTPDEAARAAGWAHVIIGTVLGPDVDFVDEGTDRKWGGRISVDRRDGRWWSFAASVGGVSIVRAIRFLCPDYTEADAVGHVRSFLLVHEGNGPEAADVDNDTGELRQLAHAEYAHELLDRAVALDGTDGQAYLETRGLGPPYPLELGWVDQARPGDGAIIASLTAAGRTVAIPLTFIDASARKSTLRPQRMRLNLEAAQPGAALLIPTEDTSRLDLGTDTIVVEGLENLLSLAPLRNPTQRLVGLPGIDTLGHIEVRRGERILVFQDSDPEGSPAREGLQRGGDGLLLKGAIVRTTDFSELGDGNAILQAAGPAALKKLLSAPVAAALSFGGQVKRLASLPLTEYEKARRRIAKEHEVRVSYLDSEVKKHRPRPGREEDEDTDPRELPGYKDYDSWAGPLPPLAEILDNIVKQLLRYVVMDRWQAQLVALWSALTYFVHHPKVKLYCMPRLGIQSPQPESGKTTLLRIVCTLAWRGEITSRTSPAGIYRALDAVPFTMCLDEVEGIVNDRNSPFLPILNASHHREDAYIRLTETRPSGKIVPIRLSVWAAMALAGNGSLPTALESRSVVVQLNKAMPGERRERLRTRETTEFIALHRQLETWAGAMESLPFPIEGELPPEIYNRAGDNWDGLFAVAKLAGKEWEGRARAVACGTTATERLPAVTERLMASVKRIFETHPDAGANGRITTADLVQALIADSEENWNTENHGRPVNPYWLRSEFRGLLVPPKSKDWEIGGKHYRGYYLAQFNDAFRRYLGEEDGVVEDSDIDIEPAESGGSDLSGGEYTQPVDPQGETFPPDTPLDTAEHPVVTDVSPDRKKHPADDPVAKNLNNTSDLDVTPPDPPDQPDHSKPAAISRTNTNGAVVDTFAAELAVDPIAVTAVLAFHERHPRRSAAWIARQIHVQKSVVTRVLAAWQAHPQQTRGDVPGASALDGGQC